MPDKSAAIPALGRHKATGQAVVRLNGRDFYLGRYGSAAARAEYNRLIAEWLANGRQLPDGGLTIAELILAYIRHAETYYIKGGVPTSEFEIIRQAMKRLRQSHGKSMVEQIGPKAFKAVRQRMIDAGLSRHTINAYAGCIRRCFRWGVEQELVPAEVFHGLQAVAGLKRGRSPARETEPVKPVPKPFVDAVLSLVCPQVATMIRFQLFTGCRPGEACTLRGCDIEMAGRVWVYRPQDHKTAHHHRQREVFIGPRAQAIIKPWLRTELGSFLFQPREAEVARNTERRQNRQSPMTPSQAARRRKRNRRRAPQDRYTVASYRRAIVRACEQAFQMPEGLRIISVKLSGAEIAERKRQAAEWRGKHCWHPHQLRRNAATLLRKEYGVELARIILGHATAFTTEIYAEADRKQAVEVIARIG